MNLQTYERQTGSGQDYAFSGYAGSTQYIGVCDGHGANTCIDLIRNLDFDEIAVADNPALAIFNKVQAGGDMFRSGATFTFARITSNVIDIYSIGDSETHVFINGSLIYTSDVHTFTNPTEIERTKDLATYDNYKAPFPISATVIGNVLSPIGLFNTGEQLVPSQSLGHNNMTGFAPCMKTISFNPTDKVRIVCGSDGLFDMWMPVISTGTAKEIVADAERQWRKNWTYEGTETNYGGQIDDISVAIWENKVVEIPSLCIPYSLSAFTTDDVKSIFTTLLGPVQKVDEFILGDSISKCFFIHFNPCEMTDVMRELFVKIDGNVKIHATPTWFWHVKRSKTAKPMKSVGWEYSRWDKTGDYYEFAETQISDKCCAKMLSF
jgi:serine/threonine protein phosphatase PrpC